MLETGAAVFRQTHSRNWVISFSERTTFEVSMIEKDRKSKRRKIKYRKIFFYRKLKKTYYFCSKYFILY
ncbi:unnamed protein product [Adineta ricciae]|uniref:Uncharacterized protein n=1 Tax=Adineta ricciae TaxID=249248 RepID=A0A813X307_ADIRI|nr:unnamed protein product [Adineta ricciae]